MRDRAFHEGRATGYAEGQATASNATLQDIAQTISNQVASATDGMDALAKASSKLDGASSEVRIDLLQELQRNPQLQDLNILVTRKPFVNAPKPPGTGGSTDSVVLVGCRL